MTVHRTDIERALNEIISNEEGMRFQGLAVVLAKQKWPDLIACERKKDGGLDARAPASLAVDGIGKGLACSITATLGKIKLDASSVKEQFDDVRVLIFATPQKVTNYTANRWAREIKEEFGYELIVMPREDFITSLMSPSNTSLSKTHLGIPVVVEAEVKELVAKAREATSEVAATWLANHRLAGRPQIELRAARLAQDGRETGESLSLINIRASLDEGKRLLLEAPAGRGKTTTLVRLAKQYSDVGRLSFLIALPAWANTGKDVLEFIAGMREFRSRGLNVENLDKLYQVEQISFLLNGWNEISESRAEGADVSLRELERSYPKAGIIIATRTHNISPPLPGASRVKLLPLTRSQRTEYLQLSLASRADDLDSKLNQNPVLDDLTRTPLFLSEVTTIFTDGSDIPTTKMGILSEAILRLEQSDEHRTHLRRAPLLSHASDYLGDLSIQMTVRGTTTVIEEEARSIVRTVSNRLIDAGQIAALPEPHSILNSLWAHHILEITDYPSVAYQFEHQQFQEFFSALLLRRNLKELVRNNNWEQNRAFAEQYVNLPVWGEPLRMVAEEIGARTIEAPDDADAINVGKTLIEIALTVDPVFAADLSRLCGTTVWREVRHAMGERLRSWYQAPDEHNRQCALAGMLATGSDDFKDIILPLVTSDDQHVRLSTYRAGTEFYVSSLGKGWEGLVREWTEDARIEFVDELTLYRWRPEIAETFALADPSIRVKAEAIRALSWVGTQRDTAKLLEALDEEDFDAVIQKLAVEIIPTSLKSRALTVYQKLLNKSADPRTRLKLLLAAAELGDTGIAEKLKGELEGLPAGNIDAHVNEYVIKPAVNILQKTDPQWISNWIARRIIDGSLHRDYLLTRVLSIPHDLKEKLLEDINADDPQLVSASGMASLLPAIADVSLAEAIFSRLCAIRRSFSGVADAQEQIRRDIVRQLEDLFRALYPDIAVAGLLDCFARGYDLIEFITVVEVFSRTDSKASDFANQLREDLRQALRLYLKNGVKFAISQEDFRGELKANLATALARFGEPEDITDLTQLARADIERVRDARAALARGERSALAMGGAIVYAHFHVGAISSLDPDQAKGVLLSLLQEPEYEVEAAFGLARLVSRNIDGPFFHKEKDYCIIWEARAKQQPIGADQELRRLLSLTFRQKINTLLDERTVSNQPAAFDYRLVELIKVLASLDSHESAELVLHVATLAGDLFLWRRVEALENLLFNGANLPTEATLNVLNPIIERVCERLYDTQGYELLVRCLSLLPFIDNPAVGVDRIHQILSDKDVPRYQLRRLIAALGCSRCHEALTLLKEFAVMDGDSPHYMAEEWIKAIAALGGQEANQILLSFIEPGADGFHSEIDVDSYHGDLLASYIVDVANADPNLKEHVLSLCSIHLAPTQRTLLSKVIARLGTVEAILAGLDLIDDSDSESIPYYLWRTLEDVFLERRPSRNSKSTYTLAPRGSNEIRERLFQLATTDNSRKRTAVSLLGQIEVWRLEHGRPNAEPRHPNFQSGKLWPLVL